MGLGFRRGSYKCLCRKGFYFPDVASQHKFFNGSLLEEEYEKLMLVGTHKLPEAGKPKPLTQLLSIIAQSRIKYSCLPSFLTLSLSRRARTPHIIRTASTSACPAPRAATTARMPRPASLPSIGPCAPAYWRWPALSSGCCPPQPGSPFAINKSR